MLNPYTPPGCEATVTPWWRRLFFWFAYLEITAGVSLGFGGCLAGLARDDSLAAVAAIYALVVGAVFLVLPGALLLGDRPHRWLGQLLPGALVLWLLLSWVTR